jgi:dipeptidase
MYTGLKRPRTAALLVFAFMLAAPAGRAGACFSIVVGKNASADGCVIVGHNEDDEAPQIVNHHKVPRRSFGPGTQVKLRNGGSLEQVEQTWAYIWSEMPGMLFSDSYVNEWGVTVASDNCPSRENRPELTDGGIGYMLRRLVAERAKTAREGVLLAASLVERFGYIDSGRTYIIADPNEGWLFCVVNGKHWLARRVPDDEVAMVANTYTIDWVDLEDKANVLAAKDIASYAESRGWSRPPANGMFDFAAAYANPQAAANPNNSGRQWSGLFLVAQNPPERGSSLPFSVVPLHKLSVTDVTGVLRVDRDDMVRRFYPADPFDVPRFVCALCSGATQTSFVAQLRRGMPLDIGIVYWVCLASPGTSFYIPFHFGIADFPAGWRLGSERPTAEAYNARVRAPFTADPQQAFWTFSNFRDKVENGGATAARKANDASYAARQIERDSVGLQKPLEETARALYPTDKAAAMRLLENYSKGVYLTVLEAMNAVLSGNMPVRFRL